MDNIFKTTIETPIGYLKLISGQNFLLSLSFANIYAQSAEYQPEMLNKTALQIGEYFNGTEKEFNLLQKPAFQLIHF
jgi:hypothetical protein